MFWMNCPNLREAPRLLAFGRSDSPCHFSGSPYWRGANKGTGRAINSKEKKGDEKSENRTRHFFFPRSFFSFEEGSIQTELRRGKASSFSHKMRRKKRKPNFSRLALNLSKLYEGKMQTVPKVPVTRLSDFSVWYTPGVAAVSSAVAKDSDLSFTYTSRWNTLCILTDGSRVLGLGDIGPEASLPVMEGKALIYKYLGGVDAIPLPVRSREAGKIIEIAALVEPSFGAVHLEDIASPKCFEILDALKERLVVPVWHDDQQGTAGVILAGLLNSLDLTGRRLADSKIVLFGAGAANIAAARLLMASGMPAGSIILVDSKGIIHAERDDIDELMLHNKWKYELALVTNEEKLKGDLDVAAKGADAIVAASKPGPGTISPKTLRKMNKQSILFALANPTPEIWPEEAKKAGVRIVATGRSDFPNQVNNSLIFPSVMRGVLDVRSRAITDEVIVEGAKRLALFARESGKLSCDRILPSMVDFGLYPRVAAAVGSKCIELGLARLRPSRKELETRAEHMIRRARATMDALNRGGLIDPLNYSSTGRGRGRRRRS
jgi:malate dehydrogenase (oxaloacetate-decarboxylating)